ncbi:tight junction protein ZO-2, partial [Aplysia californica]|uniref:Tight junction protein ZO-2 n=1 Tax=Aplysia californica TaxID=6500 RepID=A0ABM1ADW5_APLCA
MFEDEDSEDAGLASKFPAYERVLLRDADFMRPVVIYGAVSDIARERLLAEYPDRFDAPQVERSSSDGEKKGKSAIIRLGAIREAISRRKHCLLDVTPQNVDRLNYAQFHPVVVYLKADGKQAIKDVRSRWKTMSRNPRKLLEHNEKIERMYSHLFTGVLSHMGTDAWFPKLCKMIDTQQRQQVWMSEKQPTEDMSDDFMFPMSTRMSFGAGADSDLDLPRPRDDLDVSPLQKKRLVRSSSDPSVNTHENIPGIPPYPSPPTYKNQRIPSHDSRVSTSETSPRSPPRDADYQMHPEDRYYPSYYSDQMMHPSHYPANRAHIDPYATLTPSERLRPRVHAEHFQGGFDEFGPYRERLERSDQAASLSPGSVSQQGQPPMSSVAGQPPGPPSQGGQPGAYTDGSSQSSDSYSKYVSSPQNKHDDTKLREKFGSLHLSGREKSPGHDPYRFTRSTANPVTGNVDRAKLSDLSAKYRRQDSQTKGGPAVKSPGQTPSGQPPEVNGGQPVVKKKEPPPVPVKTYSLKQRGIEPDEMKMRNYENSNRAYNYSDVNNSSSRFGGPSPAGGSTPPLPPPPSSAALYMGQSDADRPYEYMSLRQAQDSLFAGGGGSGGGNNSRVDQSPQQLPSGTPPHHQNIHAGYSNNSNSN